MFNTDVGKAFAIAFQAHAGQVDKLGEPYMGHVVRVASSVEGADAQVVALLHDVVEDTDVGLAALREIFPDRICDAVDAITKRSGEAYEAYLARVSGSPLARMVKLADMADNSAPARLDRLDAETGSRLTAKYAKAKQILTGDAQ